MKYIKCVCGMGRGVMDILPFGDVSMKLKLIFDSENLLDHRLKCENFKNEIKRKVGHRPRFGATCINF